MLHPQIMRHEPLSVDAIAVTAIGRGCLRENASDILQAVLASKMSSVTRALPPTLIGNKEHRHWTSGNATVYAPQEVRGVANDSLVTFLQIPVAARSR